MSKTLKITFSQLPTSQIAPSGDIILPLVNTDQIYALTYNLAKNCTTTDKFIDLYKQTSKNDTYMCSYNFYHFPDDDEYYKLKHKLNSIIETINTMNEMPDVDVSLMLDTSSIDPEEWKLNALHLYFENTTNEFDLQGMKSAEPTYLLLEEINQLVHSIEPGPYKSIKQFFGSIRLAPNMPPYKNITLPLTDEDYSNFTIDHHWGDLLLDYFRVGKDLFTASITNDTQLVTTRGVAQQNTVHTCFQILCTEPNIGGDEVGTVGYDKWCIDNNVRSFYDIDLPMFTLGKVVLGKIDLTGTSRDEVMSELSKCTSVTNVELIDE